MILMAGCNRHDSALIFEEFPPTESSWILVSTPLISSSTMVVIRFFVSETNSLALDRKPPSRN
jgi:hypothetical protein